MLAVACPIIFLAIHIQIQIAVRAYSMSDNESEASISRVSGRKRVVPAHVLEARIAQPSVFARMTKKHGNSSAETAPLSAVREGGSSPSPSVEVEKDLFSDKEIEEGKSSGLVDDGGKSSILGDGDSKDNQDKSEKEGGEQSEVDGKSSEEEESVEKDNVRQKSKVYKPKQIVIQRTSRDDRELFVGATILLKCVFLCSFSHNLASGACYLLFTLFISFGWIIYYSPLATQSTWSGQPSTVCQWS